MTVLIALLLWLAAASLASVALNSGGAAWLLAWPAVSLGIVGGAYFCGRPEWLGKQSSGRPTAVAFAMYGPYFLLLWLLWKFHQVLLPSYSRPVRLNSTIWIGPRLAHGDALPKEVRSICDLTSEFIEPEEVIGDRRYVCCPILDAGSPTPEKLLVWCQTLDQLPPNLYIHCAQGFGRTGLVAAALLLYRSQAASGDDSLRQVAHARPGVKLNRGQRRCLEQFQRLLGPLPKTSLNT